MKYLLSVITVLNILTGCRRDNVEELLPTLPLTVVANSQPACFESKPLVRRSANLTGRISYSKEEDLYFISRSVPGTYDSVWIGYVCNLPEEYKVLDKQVVFSGEYRKGPDRPLGFAGTETYYLFLTEIR